MVQPAGRVTLNGKPVTLIGRQVEVGDSAPDFIVCDRNLSPVSFRSLSRGVCIITSVVSLDTEVCDAQVRRFNEEAAALSPHLQILVISMDLPFAQKRWCGAAGIDRVEVLSDHRDASFGTAYGVLIKDLRLLARAVFVVDEGGRIRYKEFVSEITREPNYQAALAAARELLSLPAA